VVLIVDDTPVNKLYCGVITVAASEGHHLDKPGSAIIDALSSAGHNPLYYRVVMPEKDAVKSELETALGQEGLKVLIVNGGTGLGKNDHTVELVLSMLSKQLPGFGELFRMLSYREVGSQAVKWRVLAGVGRGKLIFVLPEDLTAVKLAMDQLILPELVSMVTELTGET
jgi:molybdenum cofactor biosynthesis protein B